MQGFPSFLMNIKKGRLANNKGRQFYNIILLCGFAVHCWGDYNCQITV